METVSTASGPDVCRPARLQRSWRKWLVGIGVVGALIVLVNLAFGLLCTWRAEASLEQRDAETALSWLEYERYFLFGRGKMDFLQARAHRRLGDLNRVREHLGRAAEAGYAPARVRQEEILALAQAGQLREAEPHLGRLLVEGGDDLHEVCEAFANGFLVNYRIEEARQLLKVWAQDYPEDPQPWFAQGMIEEHFRNPKPAADNYTKALELAPDRHDIRLRYMLKLVELNLHEQALVECDRLLKHTPHDTVVLIGKSLSETSLGRIADSIKTLEEILKYDPTNRDAGLRLARTYSTENQPERALEIIERLQQEDTHDIDVRYLYAQILSQLGRRDEARKHLAFVEEANAALSRVRKKVEEAYRNPRDAVMRYEIGQTLTQYGHHMDGANWLRAALEINPRMREAHEALAKYYADQGFTELASRHQASAAQFPPAAAAP